MMRPDRRTSPAIAFWLATLAIVCLAARPNPQPPASFDLLIRGGRVLDGSGNPWVRADIGVSGGRVTAIGRLPQAQAARTILASDRVVAPGFIDVHSHAAEGLEREGLQQGQPLLAQGITTIVANPDGGGPLDLAAQRAALGKRGVGPNVALLIGHASVRRAVLGNVDRAPTPPELDRMRGLVLRAMQEGAYGLSSGPFYTPGSFARTEELIELAKVTAPFGGLYTSHIRDEGNYTIGMLAAVDEVIRVAEEGGVIGIVSHMKALGPDSWGLAWPAIRHMRAARGRGVSVYADQYPYEASSTGLMAALVPAWAQEGGVSQFKERVSDPGTRAKLLAAAKENVRRRGGAASIVVAHYAPDRALEGKHLGEIATARNVPPEVAALDLLLAGSVSIVSFNMSEDDIELIMREPFTMTSSDGGLVLPTEGKPHPRNYGAFSRKLARYVRDRETLSLESAIRSMTSLSSTVFSLEGRGMIREGAWADLVVFDPAAVRDIATYADPHRLAVGMDYVIVNGAVVIDGGTFTSALPGRVLQKGR